MTTAIIANPEDEFPQLRAFEKANLSPFLPNAYSLGHPPHRGILREVEKRFNDPYYQNAWLAFVQYFKHELLYELLENDEPGLRVKVQEWRAKDLDDMKSAIVKDLSSVENFEELKRLVLEGKWGEVYEFQRKHRRT